MAFFTARCIRDSSTCQRPSWPVNSLFQRFFCGKSHCHLSSCCLKDILSQGHWEGLRLRILRPNPSGEFFWLPQSVFSGFTWPTICVWFRTLFLESFSELRFRLCFLFWTGTPFFLKKKEDCLKKTALENHFFEDSYWQAGALYVLYDFVFTNRL